MKTFDETILKNLLVEREMCIGSLFYLAQKRELLKKRLDEIEKNISEIKEKENCENKRCTIVGNAVGWIKLIGRGSQLG